MDNRIILSYSSGLSGTGADNPSFCIQPLCLETGGRCFLFRLFVINRLLNVDNHHGFSDPFVMSKYIQLITCWSVSQASFISCLM